MEPCMLTASTAVFSDKTSWSQCYHASRLKEVTLPPINPTKLAIAQQHVLRRSPSSNAAEHSFCSAFKDTDVALNIADQSPRNKDTFHPILEDKRRERNQGLELESCLYPRKGYSIHCPLDDLRFEHRDDPPETSLHSHKPQTGIHEENDTTKQGMDGLSSESGVIENQLPAAKKGKADSGDNLSLLTSETDSCHSLSTCTCSSVNTEREMCSVPCSADFCSSTTVVCTKPFTVHCPSPPPSTGTLISCGSSDTSWNTLQQWSLRQQKREHVRKTAIRDPDAIVWAHTKKCVIEWNKEGKLGFAIKEITGTEGGEIYAMITKVNTSCPVGSSGLRVGDRVLSINGAPIHERQLKDATKRVLPGDIIRKQSREEPVCLIVQSPRSFIRAEKQCDDASTNLPLRHPSVDMPSDQGPVFRNDEMPMNRLPDLRLVIIGSYAETTAKQLVGSAAWAHREDAFLSRKCFTVIEKGNCNYEWSTPKGHRCYEVLDILKSLEKQKSMINQAEISSAGNCLSQVPESIVLEVVTLKDSAVAQYCSQLLMTSHCLYIVQFDGRSFLSDVEQHMSELQGHLDKIKTYAGKDAPVYILSTWDHIADCMLQMIEDIGIQLQQRFGSTFAKQLQYHGNCPCFMLDLSEQSGLSSPSQQQSCQSPCQEGQSVAVILSGDQGSSATVKFCSQTSSSSSVLSSMSSSSSCFSECGSEACLTFLREHVAATAFQQKFVAKTNYPCKFLRLREIVTKMRHQSQKCMLTSGIKQACGLEDSDELTSFLDYLHRQGVIISPANVKRTPLNSFVALNTDDLVHICQRLLEVPDWSEQDPSLRQHWSTLGTKAVLTPALLSHLLGAESDADCLTVCLQQLNLIHATSEHQSCDLPHDSESRSCQVMMPSYLVPFFIKDTSRHDVDHLRFHPSDRTLMADFLGYCPHGLFTKLALELCGVSSKRGGSFDIENQTLWVFNMGSDYTLYLKEDLGKCLMKFVIKSKVGFPLQNVLKDIHSAIAKIMTTGGNFILGPQCPLDYKCQYDNSSSPNAHIINLVDDHATCPLWCGVEDVRKYPSVKQWIATQAEKTGRIQQDSTGTFLSGGTAIGDLPPDVVRFVCNKLNVRDAGGRDWTGLAGHLGYSYGQVQLFETESTRDYDPCRHLLNDWGRTGHATLKNLMTALDRPKLGRKDVILEFNDRWQIVDDNYYPLQG